MAPAKSSAANGGIGLGTGFVERGDERGLGGLGDVSERPAFLMDTDRVRHIGIVDGGKRVFLAGRPGADRMMVLPILLAEDIGGALVAREQVRAVIGADEGLQRLHAGEQADEIVLAAKGEDSVDQVVADTGFALLDFEAVGEKARRA